MRTVRGAVAILLCAGVIACGGSGGGGGGAGGGSKSMTQEKAGKGGVLETVGDCAIAPLEAHGFESLSQRDRILAFYLSRAALAGRDIYYNQMGRDGLEIRNLLEEILTHPHSLPTEFREALLRYLKAFWIASGNHNERTRRKFVPEFTPEALHQGAMLAVREGASITRPVGETLDEKLQRLRRAIFDPTFEPLLTCKSAPEGRDLLSCSSVNFYDGVTMADVHGFKEAHPLNSRLAKRDGHLVEEIWRAGRDSGTAVTVPPGMYASELRTVNGFLAKAEAFAAPPQAESFKALADFFATGDPEDFRRYNLAWVHLDPEVDTINGFIETYQDPRGRKGSWQGVVFFRDPERSRMLRGLAAEARGFEERAPWDDRFKRHDFTVPIAAAVQVLLAAGDGGPVPPLGVNLPNDDAIQEKVGNRSFLYSNVLEGTNRALLEALTDEFALPEDRPLLKEHAVEAEMLQTAMHEVLGHAAGRAADGLKAEPAVLLEETYATIEEARAELVALHTIFDPRILEAGLMSSPAVAEAAYRDYLVHDLSQLRRVREGDRLEDDHMRATHLIVTWLLEHQSGAARVTRDGKTYLAVQDIPDMRKGIAALLREVQRIKSEGDLRAARGLLEAYGTRFDPGLRDEVIDRAAHAGIPSYVAFVMPEIVPVRDASGNVIDARLTPPDDFTLQMLRFSGKLPREAPAAR
jgi:dipeptidyl-peptidase-3